MQVAEADARQLLTAMGKEQAQDWSVNRFDRKIE